MKSKIATLLIPLLSAVLWAGCTTVPKPAAMVPKAIEVTNRSARPAKLTVVGEATYERKVRISNEALTQALRSAVEKSRVFSKVEPQLSGEGYELEVRILGYDPPRGGFNMAATLTSRWKLTKLPQHEVVFEDFIKQTHETTMGDAVWGINRMRETNEGVVRETIAEGLRKISKVPR
jgi:hypothetical protein